MSERKSRNTNLDLLRILSMMMVVCLHTLNHGGLIGEALIPGTVNWYLGNIIFAAPAFRADLVVQISNQLA